MTMTRLSELDSAAIERIRTGEIKAYGRRNGGMPEPIPAHHFACEVGNPRIRARDLPVEGSALRAAEDFRTGRIREPTKLGIWIDVENAIIWNDGNVEWSDISVELVAAPVVKNKGGRPPNDWDWFKAACYVANALNNGDINPRAMRRPEFFAKIEQWFKDEYGEDDAPSKSTIERKFKPMWEKAQILD